MPGGTNARSAECRSHVSFSFAPDKLPLPESDVFTFTCSSKRALPIRREVAESKPRCRDRVLRVATPGKHFKSITPRTHQQFHTILPPRCQWGSEKAIRKPVPPSAQETRYSAKSIHLFHVFFREPLKQVFTVCNTLRERPGLLINFDIRVSSQVDRLPIDSHGC